MTRGNVAHTKVHYAGKDEDFIVFVESPEAVHGWRKDKSIPLAQVLSGWKVFITHKHGAQGVLDGAPNSVLENEFGTHKEEDVVEQILEKGTVQETENSERQAHRNWTMGPMISH
jgi:ribosome maturation protein Sdo1